MTSTTSSYVGSVGTLSTDQGQAPPPNLLPTLAVRCVDDLKDTSPQPSGMSLVRVMTTSGSMLIGKCKFN